MKEKILDFSLLVVVVVAIIFFGVISTRENAQTQFDGCNISIADGDSIKFVTKEQINTLINSDTLRQCWLEYGNCDLKEIENTISSNLYVKEVEVFKNVDRKLNIDITQRSILFRVVTADGDDLYIDSDFEPLPISESYIAPVMIVSCDKQFLKSLNSGSERWKNFIPSENEKVVDESGTDSARDTTSTKKIVETNRKKGKYLKFFTEKKVKDYDKIKNLYTFVRTLAHSDFWNEMVVQINIKNDENIEIVPRVGAQTITVCSFSDIEHAEDRLNRLEGFYFKVLKKKGFEKYKKVDLRFENLVVATK